ncbi:MAG: hypothetical protein GY790_04180 [Bacteroidetes bacterium]|nr:hypothetical protein [Bacteroidota bacterium]
MSRTLVYISLVLLSTTGCSLFTGSNNEVPVARVFDRYLYPSDLDDAIPEGTSGKDSMVLANRHINTWVKEQLMLSRAEQALTEEQKDFEKQIAEYHRSLLIFSYRQKLLQQKLDTLVSSGEIQSYYQDNISNFILGHDVIKGTYIKVPLSAPRLDELRRWSYTNGEDELDNIEKYCITYAEKYSDFNDQWIYFSSIKPQLPITISQPSRYLRYNKNIETRDNLSRYFLHVSDHLPEGEMTPLEMVSDDIRSIILNKRKIEFFQDLEQMVYNDGVTRNQFEIYQ